MQGWRREMPGSKSQLVSNIPVVPPRAARQPLSSDPELREIWTQVLISLQYAPDKSLAYFGPISAWLNCHIDDSVSTCYIDANARMGMNTEFIKSLSFVQRVTCFVHEALHWVHRHPQRMGQWIARGFSGEVFNIAADIFIWHWIEQMSYGGTLEDKIGKEHVASRATLENLEAKGLVLEKPLDEYTVEELAMLLIQQNIAFDKAEIDIVPGEAGNGIERDGEGIPMEPIPDHQAIVNACFKAAQTAGQGQFPAGAVLPVTPKKPRMSPMAAVMGMIRQNLNRNYSYRRPLKKMVYLSRKMPSASPQPSSLEIALLIDTSGSTSDMWNEFYGYLEEIRRRQHAWVYLIVADAGVHFASWVSPRDAFPVIACKGGGGSDFRPAFQHMENMKERCPHRIIVLTDGFIDWPSYQPAFLSGRELITITTGSLCPYGKNFLYPKDEK